MVDRTDIRLLGRLVRDAAKKGIKPSRPRPGGLGRLEALAALGSRMAGSVPAGFSGILEGIRSGRLDPAARAIMEQQERFGYNPRTEAGYEELQRLGGALEPLSVIPEAAGHAALSLTGSPGAAVAAESVVDPLNLIPGGKAGAAAIPLVGGLTRAQRGLTAKQLAEMDTARHAAARRESAQEVLSQPVARQEPHVPLLDRDLIRDAMEGHPGVEQVPLARREPGPRQSVGAQVQPWEQESNLDLVRQQIARGQEAGGAEWYPSTYPVRARMEELGIGDEGFKDFAWANALTSDQSPVPVNVPTATAILTLQRRGEPLTTENLLKLYDEMEAKYPGQARKYFATGDSLRRFQEYLDAGRTPPVGFDRSGKITAYGQGLYGNLQNVPMDTHELAGTTLGSRLYPYWRGQGSVPSTSYGISEQPYRELAAEMGLPPSSAQASRWIGGGELTGLKTMPDRFSDIIEDLARYKATVAGDESLAGARRHLDMALTGEEPLLPYYAKSRMPINYDLFR